MSIINLAKKAEIVLAKRQIADVKARIGFAVDVSGSMQDEFESGLMQDVTDRIFALAYKMDDNGEMDLWSFDSRMSNLPTANMGNIDGYVTREIIRGNISKWGGTNYEPPITAALEKWFPAQREATKSSGFFGLFGGKSNNDGVSAAEAASLAKQPSVLMFLTDGDNNDSDACERALKAAQGRPVYFNFIGIGTQTTFRFIRQMGDRYPNVGFFAVPSVKGMSDDALYEGLIPDELAQWLKKTTGA